MTGVQTLTVDPGESEIRLDRWFKRHFPELIHGRLEKLLRTGQVRVDGKRATAGQRVSTGQVIRVPPLGEAPTEAQPPRPVAARDVSMIRALVLHQDQHMIVLNKPAGLAVQGGTGTPRHLDGMLEALRFDAAERPRLVHRLDRDTSGVFVIARTAAAARFLGDAFRDKTVRKVYWALVVGQPKPRRGKIDSPIAKRATAKGERVVEDEEDGQRAVTWYATVENAGKQASWVAMMPITGRTHQLRVHCGSVLGTPILGDRKYGGSAAFIAELDPDAPLHLHARSIRLPSIGGGTVEVTAPLPLHMREAWSFFGFGETDEDPFAEIDS
ncbi:23S rRNA pseudouridine955/2504/2580 synthase [Stella humosa]|uniref:Pseudouridine synthase n=1 Tax=Stella humosa TaxID=94 RepID=A0A3N1MB80_9PROT|nr:RluA family pseudouridine synthase [Stella humosa]ROQ00519.1 23S rRNA pseudouridine955/2504/2580 synthase [Stella humosa]BBK30237.1 pseudouridine synthase [Stella humosa]